GPAARAGLRAFARGEVGIVAGDVITAIDGEAVADADDVLAALERRQPGDRIELTLWRAGRTRKETVELAAADD
ncbi:MAG: PDZ domain-containing protein, partial [Burkholderiaceae bacterium]